LVRYYFLGDEITFTFVGVTVQVEDIYYQVDNEDVLAYLQEKSALPADPQTLV